MLSRVTVKPCFTTKETTMRDIREYNEEVRVNSHEVALLREHFSGCFNNEGNFDLEKFRTLIGDKINIIEENHGFNFLGKSYARLIAGQESLTMIRPDDEHNSKPENSNSENIYISGDNLDALKHLCKSYTKQIKCIYIDPPYNTGEKDFAYKDNFTFNAEELKTKLGISLEQAEHIIEMKRSSSASDAAWLTFMLPRLELAKDLLKASGVIFISIDDNEQANLKLLCDEVFGIENFIATVPCRVRTAKSDVPFGVSQDFDWIMVYARSDVFRAGREYNRKYYTTEDFPNRPWRIHDLTKQTSASERLNSFFTIVNPKTGEKYPASRNRTWAITEETFPKYYADNRIVFPGDYDFLKISKPCLRYWQEDDMKKDGENFGMTSVSTLIPNNIGLSENGTKDFDALFHAKLFSYPKPVELIKYLLNMALGPNNHDAVILDFFSGSATTAQAVMEINEERQKDLKYILVQIPEPVKEGSEAANAGYKTIDEIGMERIKRAANMIAEKYPLSHGDLGFKHYTLEDFDGDTVDRLYDFDMNAEVNSNDILSMFGAKVVLTTWLCRDGYGLNAEVNEVKFKDYTAYLCGKHLYLLDAGFYQDEMSELIDKMSDPEQNFYPDVIVVFGYGIGYVTRLMLDKNLRAIADARGNKITLDIRY